MSPGNNTPNQSGKGVPPAGGADNNNSNSPSQQQQQQQQQLNPFNNPQILAALGLPPGLDESVYLQRQQEFQRGFQFRQMLVAEQMKLGHQVRMDSMLQGQQQQQLKAISEQMQQNPQLQNQYRNMLINGQLQQQQQNLLRQQAAGMHMNMSPMAALQAQAHMAAQAAVAAAMTQRASLEGNNRKRSNSQIAVGDVGTPKEKGKKGQVAQTTTKDVSAGKSTSTENSALTAMINFSKGDTSQTTDQITEPKFQAPPADIADLITAAREGDQADGAAETLLGFRKEESSDDGESSIDSEEYKIAVMKGDVIDLPGFSSVLPQLPIEPEVKFVTATPPKKKTKAKDSPKGRSPLQNIIGTTEPEVSKPPENVHAAYRNPIDSWWPSVESIQNERKDEGEEPVDEDDFVDDSQVLGEGSKYRINMPKVLERFKISAEPGVLEKLPHCRVHRQFMSHRKNHSSSHLVYCWQVTELYPNDIMVCCSSCGTWRHAACGGHYKRYSARDSEPFQAVCDRCHQEEKVLRDHPLARARINRQRSEQVRRALATSAVMRQSSFSKYGGTYKWPLGSVSSTHIGGHTKSVHSRHDKAEKQWKATVTNLNKPVTGKSKNQLVKTRTKEFERLLAVIEDSEGQTDRHNMLLFLLDDVQRKHPVGYETRRLNIFDPAEDEALLIGKDSSEDTANAASSNVPALSNIQSNDDTNETSNGTTNGTPPLSGGEKEEQKPTICARKECTRKPRFDSLFCSDSCGVSAMESDLLRTFLYSSDMHPSVFRQC